MKPRLLFISNLFPDQSESYRGLDNATVLHRLKNRWDIEVLSLRPTLKFRGAKSWDFRDCDAIFHPRYVPIRYLPKIGGIVNHHLAKKDLLAHPFASRLQGRYDAILGSWLYPDGYAVAALAKQLSLPFAMIAQGSDVHRYLKSPWRKHAILKSLETASAVITRSRSLATLLAQAGIPEPKLHCIHNGVHLDTFYPPKLPRDADAEKPVQLLFVGNLLPVKNPNLLLEAFAILQRQRLPLKTQLTVVGKGPLQHTLEQHARVLGLRSHITFAGPKSAAEVSDLMRKSHLLLLTSRNEGLPNVVLEAQASGLRVVATDVGGLHEVIDAPWKGTLVASSKAKHFADAMAAQLQSPPFEALLRSHAATLSWSSTSDQYHKLLMSLLPPQPRYSL